MAKNESKSQASMSDALEGAMLQAPEGMRQGLSRSEGFWDENAGVPMYGRLVMAREVTPTKGPSKGKVRRYYVFELGAPTMLAENKDKSQPSRPAKKGDIIGVWATPGMSDLNRMQGCVVWLNRNSKLDLDTGKGNLMKGYDIRTRGDGVPVKVVPFNSDEDTGFSGSHMGNTPPSGIDGEIPF